MDRNICNDGSITYTSSNNYCRYKWYAAENNNRGNTAFVKGGTKNEHFFNLDKKETIF